MPFNRKNTLKRKNVYLEPDEADNTTQNEQRKDPEDFEETRRQERHPQPNGGPNSFLVAWKMTQIR